MKQNILLTILLLLSSTWAISQDKVNPAGRSILNDYKKFRYGMERTMSGVDNISEAYTSIVVLKEDADASCLDIDGVNVLTILDNIVIAYIQIDKMDEVTRMSQVKAVSFGDVLKPYMDYARTAGNVSSVHDGFSYNGKTMSFDGTGVVCGMMDTGLDANHVNFKNADGSSRVQRLWELNYNTSTGKVTSTEYTSETVNKFTTDNASGSHATHVAGIMAGSYNREGTYAYTSSANGKNPQDLTGDIPYYGVATGADLAFSVGKLYSPSIIQGIANIVDYAESVGKPSVVNLSLGHTYGPHDGTDAYSQALEKLGKRTIICMSSGNDGDVPMSITKAFTSSDQKILTQLVNNKADGIIDIWGNDNSAFTVKWALYSLASKTFTYLCEVTGAGQTVNLGTGNADFAKYFTGSISIQSNINTLNNRYNVYNDIYVNPLTTNTDVFISLIVEGEDGQTIYVYGGTDASFTSQSLSGWTDGSKANSINDSACAQNVLSVGSYTTRTTWGVFGARYGYYDGTFKLNKISPFSSYGTSFQGKALPLVCGPGAAIISSYSRYYVANTNSSANMTAKATVNGVENYWSRMQGTSMSCPFVAGTIALWLQADPTLTFDRVLDAVENSSSYNSLKNGTPKAAWGAGAIDALAGIKYVLDNRAAIGEVWADDSQRLIVTRTDGGYEVFVADSDELTATLYDLQGRPVAVAQGNQGTATVEADRLQHGIYILEARTPSLRLTRKVTL